MLIYITAITTLYLCMVRRWGAALFVFVSVAGGQVLSSLLKLGIDRPRPDLVSHLAQVHTMSFPSGHAMLSAVTYLTLGALLARFLPGRATTIFVLRRRRADDADGRHQPGLSRRPLAVGRAGRLVRRLCLGDAVLDGQPLAACGRRTARLRA